MEVNYTIVRQVTSAVHVTRLRLLNFLIQEVDSPLSFFTYSLIRPRCRINKFCFSARLKYQSSANVQ